MPKIPLAACRIKWHHLMVAFLSGILVAYAFLNLSIGHPLLRAAQGIERSGSWGPEASREAYDCPRSTTFPFAVGNATEDYTAPDKLIIAARHTEARTRLM